MTVADLVEELQKLPQYLRVVDKHDHPIVFVEQRKMTGAENVASLYYETKE